MLWNGKLNFISKRLNRNAFDWWLLSIKKKKKPKNQLAWKKPRFSGKKKKKKFDLMQAPFSSWETFWCRTKISLWSLNLIILIDSGWLESRHKDPGLGPAASGGGAWRRNKYTQRCLKPTPAPGSTRQQLPGLRSADKCGRSSKDELHYLGSWLSARVGHIPPWPWAASRALRGLEEQVALRQTQLWAGRGKTAAEARDKWVG